MTCRLGTILALCSCTATALHMSLIFYKLKITKKKLQCEMCRLTVHEIYCAGTVPGLQVRWSRNAVTVFRGFWHVNCLHVHYLTELQKIFLHEWQLYRLVVHGCDFEYHIQQNVTVYQMIIIQIGRATVKMIVSAVPLRFGMHFTTCRLENWQSKMCQRVSLLTGREGLAVSNLSWVLQALPFALFKT